MNVNLVKELIDNKKYDEAYVLIDEALREDPDDFNGLFSLGYLQQKAQKHPMAYVLFTRVIQIRPKCPEAWMNLGMINDKLFKHKVALNCYRKALKFSTKNKLKSEIWADMANSYLSMCQPDEALKCIKKSLDIDPFCKVAKVNESFAWLQKREWGKGWDAYKEILGTKHRPEQIYGDETRWNGEKGKNIILYGEQGIGDEIMFSSVIPDAQKDNTLVLECDPRLETLFKRSFPEVYISGTRGTNETKIPDIDIHHRSSISDLCRYYRRNETDFPRTKYLKADPEKVQKWKKTFNTKKPVIGISWSGGRIDTGGIRFKPLKEWEPLFEFDAVFVNLNYKDKDSQGYPILEYHATSTDDYDDTASLVAALDMVITVPTSVCHLAGALGVETLCLVPDYPRWSYGLTGEHPWYESVKIFRDWKTSINQIGEYLDKRGIQKVKRKPARNERKLRDKRKTVGFIGAGVISAARH